jgi:hypothetical protein
MLVEIPEMEMHARGKDPKYIYLKIFKNEVVYGIRN